MSFSPSVLQLVAGVFKMHRFTDYSMDLIQDDDTNGSPFTYHMEETVVKLIPGNSSLADECTFNAILTHCADGKVLPGIFIWKGRSPVPGHIATFDGFATSREFNNACTMIEMDVKQKMDNIAVTAFVFAHHIGVRTHRDCTFLTKMIREYLQMDGAFAIHCDDYVPLDKKNPRMHRITREDEFISIDMNFRRELRVNLGRPLSVEAIGSAIEPAMNALMDNMGRTV